MSSISVKLSDIELLIEQTCKIDEANATYMPKQQITQLIGKMHQQLEQILGEHATKFYAPDDGEEYDPRN